MNRRRRPARRGTRHSTTNPARAEEPGALAVRPESLPQVPRSDRDVARIAIPWIALFGLGAANWGGGMVLAGLLGWLVFGRFTVERYAHRGEGLLPWLVRYSRSAGGSSGLAAFERLARSRAFGRPVRRDAAARAALLRLERGELEEAITTLRIPDDDISRRVALDRSGTFGGIVRSILGYLFPEASLVVSTVDVFDAPVSDPLRQTLDLLEQLAQGYSLMALRTWASLDVDHLHARYPTLLTLVHGSIVRVDPGERDPFLARVDGLEPAAAQLVRRRYPELTARSDGYRHGPRPQQLTTALAIPDEIVAQRRMARPVVGEPPLPLARLTTIIGNNLWVSFLLGAFLGLPGGAMLAILLVSGLGPRIATRVRRAMDRRERLEVLRGAGIHARPRLRELRDSTIEPMLVIALHRAERAIEDGRPDDAREQIGWWLHGLTAEEVRSRRIHPVAASALRTATLLGYERAAAQLLRGIQMDPNRRRGSGHGNAEQALRLAQALFVALRGDYEQAGRRLEQAAGASPVVLDDYEAQLYGELLRRLEARDVPIPASLSERWNRRPTTPAPWITTIWPDSALPAAR